MVWVVGRGGFTAAFIGNHGSGTARQSADTHLRSQGERDESAYCSAFRSALQLSGDGIHQLMADARIEGRIDLANAGRAGDVDLREMFANDIQANE